MYKLIIIDDETMALEQFADIMDWENYGFTLEATFCQSEDALSYIKNNEVDLVFTDIKMPKVSGLDIARECLEQKNPPYVVFISAYSDFEYARQAIQYNICDYLIKPFSFSDIENILIKVYKLLQQKSNSNLFVSNLEILEQQYVLTDLVSGNYSSVEELKEKFVSINIPSFLTSNACAEISVTIDNFDEYIAHVWKHGKEKLYNAISYLANIKTPIFCSSFEYIADTFRILAIDINGRFEHELNKYTNELRENLKQLLLIENVIIEISHTSTPEDYINEIDSGFAPQHDDSIIQKSYEYIRKHYKRDISLDEISKHINLSRVYFCSYFKKMTGDNFISELNRYRIEKAKEYLSSTDITISSVAEEVGYKSIPYFYKTFTKFTGHTPTEYRTKFRKESNE